MKRVGRLSSLVLLTVVVAACGIVDPPTEDAVTVAIDQGAEADLPVGGDLQLDAVVDAEGDATEDVEWTTSDPDVATVSPDGLVSAADAATVGDEVEITVTSEFDSDVSDAITLTVVAAPTGDAVTVAIDQGAEADLPVGGDLQLDATVETQGAATAGLTWETSDPAIATVTDEGLVSATDTAAVGDTVDITATSTFDTDESDTITLTVVADTGVTGDLYVDDDATGDGDGSSTAPFATIGEAITAADDGQTIVVRDGDYAETLVIDKPLTLDGEGTVTITTDGTGAAEDAEGVIDVAGVTGVTFRDFALVVDGATGLSAVVAIYAGASEVTLENVDVDHGSTLNGVSITDSSSVTLDGVSVIGDDTGNGAGVLIAGASSDVELLAVDTDGHANFAGAVLDPDGATMSGITIDLASNFAEVNKMTAILTGGGDLTNLDADEFTHVIRNLHPEDEAELPGVYGAGDWWFYKYDEEIALRDALFNFGEDTYFIDEGANLGIDAEDVVDAEDATRGPWNGAASVVHVLDTTDQAELGDEIVVGQVTDDFYGYGFTRSSNIQVAIDQAAALAEVGTVRVQVGTYRGHDGQVTLPADVVLQGQGTDVSVVVAEVGTVDEVIVGPGEPGNRTDVGEALP